MRTLRLLTLLFLASIANNANAQLQPCADQGTSNSWTSVNLIIDNSVIDLATPILLTDGRVMVQNLSTFQNLGLYPWQSWFTLTPDNTGSYVNGTWSSPGQIASLRSILNGQYAPAAFASAVLADGKVIIMGGEDNNGQRVETNLGAIYDPVANTWTAVNAPNGGQGDWQYIGDAPSTVIANGKYLLGNACSGDTALYTESNGWTSTGSQQEYGSEASYTLLPSGNVLTVDTCLTPGSACNPLSLTDNSEFYNPTAGTWSSAGNTGTQLYGSGYNSCFGSPGFGEQGPAILRPDGTYFATGGYVASTNSVHTAIYNPIDVRPWLSNPDLPTVSVGGNSYPLTAEDSGAAVLTDGNTLIAAYTHGGNNPPFLIEPMGSSYCQITTAPSSMGGGEYQILTLPTGQLMFTSVSWAGSSTYYIFTPGGTTYPGIAPTLNGIASTKILLGSTYQLTGTRFNGYTQATEFGDDFQNATNYPLVRITNDSSGHVFYARTHDHSTMGVATGNNPTYTYFDVPSNMETGLAHLVVVANGIASNSIPVNVQP